MSEQPKFEETPLRRDDITKLLETTKKMAETYGQVLEKKREGWERVLKAKLKREQEDPDIEFED